VPTRSSRIGAICYALWGVIHIIGGAVLLQAALEGTDAFVRAQVGGSLLDVGALSGSGSTVTVVSSVFAFHAFNLTWLGLLAGFIAVRLNWYNASVGYWLNLALVGFTDLGLVLFIVGPGVMSWADAWIGPALFVPAWFFSTLGMRDGRTPGVTLCPSTGEGVRWGGGPAHSARRGAAAVGPLRPSPPQLAGRERATS
jgi:hypothetical protein